MEGQQLLHYSDRCVLEDKIFNLVDALGPNAVQGWRQIPENALQNPVSERLPQMSGLTPIWTTGEIIILTMVVCFKMEQGPAVDLNSNSQEYVVEVPEVSEVVL